LKATDGASRNGPLKKYTETGVVLMFFFSFGVWNQRNNQRFKNELTLHQGFSPIFNSFE
jgi:hypothetical protein